MKRFPHVRMVLLIATIVAYSLTVTAATLPSSARARSAIETLKPRMSSELQDQGLRYGAPIFIRIFKEQAQLELWIDGGDQFTLFKTYEICDFSGDLGPKFQTGDCQSPEGFYFVTPGQLNPTSRFHLSLNLGYPNAYDRHHGRTGSALMVHGACVSIGCYAMTNAGIEEIYTLADAAFRGGQSFFRVHIFPFRMTSESMQDRLHSRWWDFWKNLKQGYDMFEEEWRPPNVEVNDGRYVFEAR